MMSILSEIETNKDSKTRKARKVIRKYKITSPNDKSKYQRGTKAKNANKSTEGKTT